MLLQRVVVDAVGAVWDIEDGCAVECKQCQGHPKGVLNLAHDGLLLTPLESRFKKDGEFVIGGKAP